MTNIAIIGNGNVAMDVARVLAAPYKHFCPTDMNCHAIRELHKSKIKKISVVARRGVEHSAFTTKEFRELTKLGEGVQVHVDEFDLDEKVKKLDPKNPTDRPRKRQMELVHQFCPPTGAEKQLQEDKGYYLGRVVDFRYGLTPIRLIPRHDGAGVAGVLCQRTETIKKNRTPGEEEEEGSQGTDINPSRIDLHHDQVLIPADIVIRSVGYKCDGIRGVPFDDKANHIPHVKGRVDGVSRLYCSGWAKRGPKGVILQTLMDAQETAKSVLEDLEGPNAIELHGTSNNGKFDLVDKLVENEVYPVTWGGVQRIWNQEKERGFDLGKAAEKVPNVRDMVDMAMSGRIGRKAAERVRGIAPSRPPGFELMEEWLDEDTMLVDMGDTNQTHSVQMEQHKLGGWSKKY